MDKLHSFTMGEYSSVCAHGIYDPRLALPVGRTENFAGAPSA